MRRRHAGSASDHLKLKSVVITPNPPHKGERISVNASGDLNEIITGGQVHVTLKYGIITIVDQTFDLCKLSPQYPCPVKQGPFSIAYSGEIPGSAPGVRRCRRAACARARRGNGDARSAAVAQGRYTGNLNVKDQAGQPVACINLDFRL